MAPSSGRPLPPALSADPGLPGKLMVFDGVCVLCNGGVRFVLRRERRPDFVFTPVQSGLGQRVLSALGQPLDGHASMVVIDGGRFFLKSDAVVQTARALKAPWRWGVVLRFLPRSWRDRAYELLARNRYNIFGRYDTCVVPDAALRRRFVE
ncbi:MAG: thiol-disulfide oxidoreductase DCC family protein [Kiloniellaceae bacterium]